MVPLIASAAIALAQEPKESVPPTTPSPQTDPSRVVYDLEVSPADEPRPAMKYRLLPNPADLKPGNAATQYYKAFAIEGVSPIRTEAYRKLSGWLEEPLHELNIEEVGRTLRTIRDQSFYHSIRTATHREICDWEEPVEEQGIGIPLPAMFDLRSVGRLLTIKGKYEIGIGSFDEAILTGRDSFTLSYHLQNSGELAIQVLVGIEIVGMMHGGFFLNWIRAPDSPNLYWALSEVPAYYDSRKFITGDLQMPEYTLPALKEIDRRTLTVDEAYALADRAFQMSGRRSRGSRSAGETDRRIDLAAWALQAYDESFRDLTAAGVSEGLLNKMPVLQVALLGRWRRYQALRDDLYKWAAITYGPDRELALRKQDEIRDRSSAQAIPFDEFLPSLRAMYQAQLRQHRFLCALRAIEALRLYAARHGKWPQVLADVREVPVPDDPVTNAPFVYQASGNNATLVMVRHRHGANLEHEYRLRLRDRTSGKP